MPPTITNQHTRALNFGDFKDGKAQQPLPPSLTQHESEISGFANLCNKTCNRILNLLALGLEVHPNTKPNQHQPQPQQESILKHDTDPKRLLHLTPRPSTRVHRQHPALPVLPINLLAGNSSLQARQRRARRRPLRLRQHHAALPATRTAGAGDPDAGGDLGACAHYPRRQG